MAELDVLDDDDEVRYLATGPGRRRRSTGPVLDAYADGPIERHCDNCGVGPLQFCRYDDGTTRKIPCSTR